MRRPPLRRPGKARTRSRINASQDGRHDRRPVDGKLQNGEYLRSIILACPSSLSSIVVAAAAPPSTFPPHAYLHLYATPSRCARKLTRNYVILDRLKSLHALADCQSTRVYIVKRTEIVIDLINRAAKACHASGIINPILSNVYSLKYEEGRLENINSARSFLARPFKFDRDTVIANVREISMGRFANTHYAPMGSLVTGTPSRDQSLVGHQSYRLKGAMNCTSPVLTITSHDIAEFFALANHPSQHPGHVCSELQLFADIRSDRESPIRPGEWLNYIHTIAMSCLQDPEAVLPELHGPTEQMRNILTTGDDDEHIALFNDLGAVRPLDTSEPDFDMSFPGHDEGLLPQGVHQSAEATQWRDWLSVDSPDRPSALVRDPQSGLPLDPNKTGPFPSVSLRVSVLHPFFCSKLIIKTASTLDPAATTFQPPSSDRRYSIAALKAFTWGHRLEQFAGLTASAPAALQDRPASAHGSAVVQLRRGARTTGSLSDRLLAGAITYVSQRMPTQLECIVS